MKPSHRFTLLLTLLALLIFAGVAFAQAPTEEPTQPAPTPEPTEEPVPVVETGTGTDVTINVPAAETADSTANFNALLALAIAVGSLMLGGGGAWVMFQRGIKDKEVKNRTEELLYNSVPLAFLNRVYGVTTGVVKPVADFVADVTDGKPNNDVFTFTYTIPEGQTRETVEEAINKALADMKATSLGM